MAGALLFALAAGGGFSRSARAADTLLFCNRPERLRAGGVHADAPLAAGQTYRVFFHFRNDTPRTGPLVIALENASTNPTNRPLSVLARKGIADPRRDPSEAGRQAMARFLQAPPRRYAAQDGTIRFALTLKRREVASGVLSVRADRNARLRIFWGSDAITW